MMLHIAIFSFDTILDACHIVHVIYIQMILSSIFYFCMRDNINAEVFAAVSDF